MDDEFEADGIGYTWLWRNCCLNKVKESFQMNDCAGSKIMATAYNWGFTRDTGCLTIAGKKKSVIRRGGLVFSQFYMMNKLQFDTTKHFPWDDDDDTMAAMAVDSVYREALRSAVGAKAMDMKDCRTSYNHCGRRFVLGVRMNDSRSWGAREEHRMSLALLMAVNVELQSRGNPELRRTETRTQFYVHKTQVVNQFMESVTLPLARWYQEVLGMAAEGMLGIDRQKLAILLCLLVKNSYGGALLQKHGLIWEKKVKRGDEPEEYGLGLKDVIDEYGFGWLNPAIFDWESNNFARGIAERFPFPVRCLERRYQAKKRERKVMVELLQEVDQATGRIRLLGNSPEDRLSRKVLIWWLAMRIIKQYHMDVWVGLYESPYEFAGKDREREKQEREEREEQEEWEDEDDSDDEEEERSRPVKRRRPSKKNPKAVYKSFDDPPELTYASVRKELAGEKPHPCKRGKQYLNRRDIFDLLFLSQFEADNGLKQGWKKQAHLHGLKAVKARLKQQDYEGVVGRMRRLFGKYCLCIPAMTKDRWLAPSAHSKLKPTWIGFDEDGNRMDYPDMEDGYGGVYGSTWHQEVSIHEDYFWNIVCDEATNDEGLRRGREYLSRG